MFKNPLKYQQGGQLNEQQQQMLAAFIDWLPKRVKEFQGMKPEAIVQALDGMSKTPEGQKQVQQLMEQFQQESQSGQSFKRGGKIQDFICKHAKGGVTECGCKKSVEKHQQENGKGRGIIGALSELYNRFIGQRMPDVPGINNRRVRTWTDANGIQHIVEDANVNGNSTVTTIDINGADTLGNQKITTGDGRYRMVNLQPGTPQWRSVMSRDVPQQENGGKVEKAQFGLSGMPVNPNVVQMVYNKIDDFLTPANRWEEEHGTKVIGGLGLPAYVSPQTSVLNVQKLISNRIPAANKRVPYYGKIKVNRTLDHDIDKMYSNYPLKRNTYGIQMEAEHPQILDYDIDKAFTQTINPIEYNKPIRLEDLVNVPKFIFNLGLKAAPGIIGSAALGSYAATKNNQSSGGGSR